MRWAWIGFFLFLRVAGGDVVPCDRLLKDLDVKAGLLAGRFRHDTFTQLAKRARAGDVAARDEFFELLSPFVQLQALRSTPRLQPADAADAAQEALIAIFDRLEETDGRKGDIFVWAGAIVRNKVIDRHRRLATANGRAAQFDGTERDVPERGRTPERWKEYDEYLRDLVPMADALLQDVPARDRQIFFEYVMSNVTLAELGRRHGISEGSTSRVVSKVREKLEERMDAPPP